MDGLKVVKVGHGFFDVFMGMGWTNTFRIRMVKNTLILPEKVSLKDDVKQAILKDIKQGNTKFSNFVMPKGEGC